MISFAKSNKTFENFFLFFDFIKTIKIPAIILKLLSRVLSEGPVRKIIHPSIYMCVASLYFIMEIYIKWKTRLQNIAGLDNEISNINKSGPISYVVTLTVVLQTLSDFTVPKLISGPEYYLIKVFISNVVLISPTKKDLTIN